MRKELATVVDHHPDRCVNEVVGRLVQRDQVLRILWTDVSDHATDADGDCKCGWSFCRDVVVSLCHCLPFLLSELSCGVQAVLAIGEWGEQSASVVCTIDRTDLLQFLLACFSSKSAVSFCKDFRRSWR